MCFLSASFLSTVDAYGTCKARSGDHHRVNETSYDRSVVYFAHELLTHCYLYRCTGGLRYNVYGVYCVRWVLCNMNECVSMSMCVNTCTIVCLCTKVREWVSNAIPYLSHSFVMVTSCTILTPPMGHNEE